MPGVDAADPALRAMVQPLNPPAPGAPDAVARAAKDASVDAFRLAVLVCGALLALGGVANGVGLRSKAARAGGPGDRDGRCLTPPSGPRRRDDG